MGLEVWRPHTVCVARYVVSVQVVVELVSTVQVFGDEVKSGWR